jgi:hypothetical protein
VTSSETTVVEASAVLDALRTPFSNVIGLRVGVADKPEDQPIYDAWTLALQRFRLACQEYVAAK